MAEDSQAAEASTQASLPRPIYELGYHVVPTVGDEGVASVVDAVRTALAAPSNGASAEFITDSFPQKMTLAYTVERSAQGKREKYTESYFGNIKFALEREMLPQVQEKLRAMQSVLRFLIIETVREDITKEARRAVFVSDRLEGKTLEKPVAPKEMPAEVSQEELDKSIDALTQ